jgi:hypothetical protein
MTIVSITKNETNKNAIAPMPAASKDVRRMLGLSLHGWENSMVVFLIVAGFFALLAGAATWAVVRLQRVEIAESKTEFEKYQQDSNERISAADARAAEANRIAEGERLARLKLEKEMAWRSLDDAQRRKLIVAVRQFAGQVFDLVTYQDDPEAKNFANILAQALLDAGWKLEPPSAFLAFQIELGVRFEIAPSAEAKIAPAVNALHEICQEIGITASAGLREGLENDKPHAIKVRVGKKPERVAR